MQFEARLHGPFARSLIGWPRFLRWPSLTPADLVGLGLEQNRYPRCYASFDPGSRCRASQPPP